MLLPKIDFKGLDWANRFAWRWVERGIYECRTPNCAIFGEFVFVDETENFYPRTYKTVEEAKAACTEYGKAL